MSAREIPDEVARLRVPPHSIEAEQSLLGGLLLDNRAWDRVGDIVSDSDFYRYEHRLIYAAIGGLINANKPADVITVFEQLQRTKEGRSVEASLPYLNTLAQSVPSAANARRYAEIVREYALQRALIAACDEAQVIAFDSESAVSAKLDTIGGLFGALERGQMRKAPSTMDALVVRALDRYNDLATGTGPRGWKTGIPPLDRLLLGRGLLPGKLYGIGARPSVGKSSVARSIGLATAMAGHPTLLLSQEMGEDEVTDCIIAQLGGIDSDRLQSGALADQDWRSMTEAVESLRDAPFYVDDQGALTLADIRAKARQVKGLKVLILDYLQLSASTLKGANRNDQIEEISRGLKALAMEMGIAILVLSQLNREVEKRVDKEPRLSDLRDCLPGDAEVVNADTGERIKIADVVRNKMRFNVWALGSSMKLERRPIIDAWATGRKTMVKITTRTGRVLKCSEGHRLLDDTLAWRRAADFRIGDGIGVPRAFSAPTVTAPRPWTEGQALLLGWLLGDGNLQGSAGLTVATHDEASIASALASAEFGIEPRIKPDRRTAERVVMTTGRLSGAGKNPLTRWLRDLGVWGRTGIEKVVPMEVYQQADSVTRCFLRGMFHADGTLTRCAGGYAAKFCSVSPHLAKTVHGLLIRLGYIASLRSDDHRASGFRTRLSEVWTVAIQDMREVNRFVHEIGFLGEKQQKALSRLREKMNDAGQLDRMPMTLNSIVKERRTARGLSHARLGWRDQGKQMSRKTAATIASVLGDEEIEQWATSDVFWDEVIQTELQSPEEAYELTVDKLHNFCVDDFLTHNCGGVEQDLDVALLLWTVKEFEESSRRIVGALLAKQRGGKRNVRFALEFHANVYRWFESTWNMSKPEKSEPPRGFE